MNLSESYLFKGVDEQYINDFLASCVEVEIKKGDFIFHGNETGDNMYIVKQGKFEMILDESRHDFPRQALDDSIMQTGSVIGELCVFGQKQRSASVMALEDSILLKIEGEDFRIRVYSKELDALLICYNIATLLSKRLMSTFRLLQSDK